MYPEYFGFVLPRVWFHLTCRDLHAAGGARIPIFDSPPSTIAKKIILLLSTISVRNGSIILSLQNSP